MTPAIDRNEEHLTTALLPERLPAGTQRRARRRGSPRRPGRISLQARQGTTPAGNSPGTLWDSTSQI